MNALSALGLAALIALAVDILVLAALRLSWRTAKEIAGPASSANRPGWRDRRRWRRVIARVGVGAVALVPLALLNGRLLGAPFQTGPFPNAYTYSAHRSLPDARSVYDQGCPARQNVLTLIVHSADVVRDTVEVGVALCVGDQTLRQLTLWAGGKPAFPHGINGNVSKGVLRSTFGVVYDGIHPAQTWVGQASINQIRMPSQFNASSPFLPPVREPIYLGTFALNLVGNAGDYPLDIYSAYGQWWLLVPNGMYPGGVVNSIEPEIPVTTSILTSPGGAELNWRSDVYYRPASPPTEVTLGANRGFPTLLFIVVIILLPLLLFIGVLWTFRPKLPQLRVRPPAAVKSGKDDRLPAELLVGVGTFLLAVFPIRLVLVPPDISRLTIVDYCLGTEMAAIVAGTLWLALAVSETPDAGSPPGPKREAPPSGESKESSSGVARNASSRHPNQEGAIKVAGEGRLRTDGPARVQDEPSRRHSFGAQGRAAAEVIGTLRA